MNPTANITASLKAALLAPDKITWPGVASWFADVAKLAETLMGEAEGESYLAKRAVAQVIENRRASGAWGNSYTSVVLAPLQFSCWDDPARAKVILRPNHNHVEFYAWHECWEAAISVAANAPALLVPEMRNVLNYVDIRLKDNLPTWAKKMEPFQTDFAPKFIWLRTV